MFYIAEFSFEVTELNWNSNTVEVLDAQYGDAIVRTYASLIKNPVINFDGKDGGGNFLADGFYKLKITSVYLAGNTSIDTDTIVVIDNFPPLLSINFPLDGAWFNSENLDFSGITEIDAVLTIENETTSEFKTANIDPSTGVFSKNFSIIPGFNEMEFYAIDTVMNSSTRNITVYKENLSPEINSLVPNDLFNSQLFTISIDLSDLGVNVSGNDYISGINSDSVYLSLFDYQNNEIVLVNEGIDVSTLGYINHNCTGSGDFGL